MWNSVNIHESEDVSLSQIQDGLHETQCVGDLSQMDTNHSISISDNI